MVLAWTDGPDHYGLLSDAPISQWTEIEAALRMLWKTGEPDSQNIAVSLSGCLQKLGSSLLQGARLRQHRDGLLALGKRLLSIAGAEMEVRRGDEALGDFEGQLLQGRATLDRLTWFLASRFK